MTLSATLIILIAAAILEAGGGMHWFEAGLFIIVGGAIITIGNSN